VAELGQELPRLSMPDPRVTVLTPRDQKLAAALDLGQLAPVLVSEFPGGLLVVDPPAEFKLEKTAVFQPLQNLVVVLLDAQAVYLLPEFPRLQQGVVREVPEMHLPKRRLSRKDFTVLLPHLTTEQRRDVARAVQGLGEVRG